jgi:uncharacterized protein (DUF58 family)
VLNRITHWLETNWITPAYAGWLLIVLTICFFGAATNTMAGWLYVLSGVGVALLGIAALLPARSLQVLTVKRLPIAPVTAGDDLEIAIEIHNPSPHPQTLFQVQDLPPFNPSEPPLTAVEAISSQDKYTWVYRQPTQQRGVYGWERLVLRSGAPIGLFWCRRDRREPITAYVYPQVLSLSRCPLIDGIGTSDRLPEQQFANRYLELATEGVTRSLRPYRYGDPLRSIHWRTSARYGEFQVREWEIERGGQDVVICLDSEVTWDVDHFEQAVIAACSLYFYAQQAQLHVKLWTAATGLISGDREVLEALATVQMDESHPQELPSASLIWLTSQPQRLSSLPLGSRWALWSDRGSSPPYSPHPGIVIHPTRSLSQQLTNAQFSSHNPDWN